MDATTKQYLVDAEGHYDRDTDADAVADADADSILESGAENKENILTD